MTTNVELWMSFDSVPQLVLSISVSECQRFSVHPLAWLRYVGFTIYGNEGHISLLADGPEVDYYQTNIQAGVYYYISQQSFLLDPDLMEDRTSDASTISTSRDDFRIRVTNRDRTCVMTGASIVTACHVIPHAKGHQYMINLAHHRHENLEPPLESINDTRNGILLYDGLYSPFGASKFAFLKTPNFAMTVNDVDLVQQPNADLVHFVVQPSAAQSRTTLQHFNLDDEYARRTTPHNSDARQADSDDWPPPLIFDVAYGCATLKTWGVPSFMKFAQGHTRNIYYDDDDYCSEGDGAESDPGVDGDQIKKGLNQVRDRAERFRRRAERSGISQKVTSKEDQAPDLANMILALWTHNAKKGQQQVQVAKLDRTHEKVRAWLDSVE